MNTYKYFLTLLLSKIPIIGGGNRRIIRELIKQGAKIGNGTHIFSNISAEPYLIEIGSNCTISTEVSMITHDASIGIYMGRNNYSDLCGKIKIGDNCFIGSKSIIMYGVSLPNNTLVAAGSVVTRSIKEEGMIVGGNPAKIIGKISDFLEKSAPFMMSLNGKTSAEKKEIILMSQKFIKR